MGGILLILGVVILILDIFLLRRSNNDYANRLFAITVFFISLWVIFMSLFFLSTDAAVMRLSMAMFYASGVGIVALLYLISIVLRTKKPISYRAIVHIAPLILLAIISLTPGSIISYVDVSDKDTVVANAIGYTFYMVAFVLYYGAALVNLFIAAYSEKKDLIARKQVFSLFFAFSLSGLVSIVVDIILPFIGHYEYIWIGPVSLILFLGILIFATVRYRLFDFRTAVLNWIGFVCAFLLVVAVYFIAVSWLEVYFLSDIQSQHSRSRVFYIAIAIASMALFPLIRHFFDDYIERILYRDRFKISDFVKDLGVVISSSTEMKIVLRRTAKVIQRQLKANYAVYIVRTQSSIDVYGTQPRPYFDDKDVAEILTIGDRLKQAEYVSPIVNFGIIRTHKHDNLIKNNDIAFIMPIFKEKTHIGCLIIGGREKGDYTPRDLLALRTISTEISIAVQNMLSVLEINKMNAELEERVREATVKLRKSNARLREMDTRKDEFMSMASHQLRTPLTSIKGYVSGVLEGDAGDINDMQRMMLGQAFNSSERMVHLVGDLLNLSRIQNGKFVITPVEADLGQVINEEIGNTTPTANDRSITLQTHIDKKIGKVHVDIDKVRQVIMNFIDNAIYYSPPNSTVTVTLTRNKSTVECRVIDKGIGVPKEQREHLFTKFFRADNAKNKRPDGTGIGLFLAKRVIDEHGGEIIFESEEGKGSTFGFILPVKPIKK